MKSEWETGQGTHSFEAMLRSEIRRDIDQVPDEQRPAIIRDIYRNLLGTTRDGLFTLNAADGLGLYTVDEALGHYGVYRLWRSAWACSKPACAQH